MPARSRPTARRIGLGHELRTYRRKAGLTLAQAVEGLPFDITTLQRVESGYRSLRQAAWLRSLLERYGVTDEEEIDRLVQFQREGSSREWWTGTSATLVSGMARFLGVEQAAREIRVFHPVILPGLLQTEEYARAVIGLHRPIADYTVSHSSDALSTRMGRQEVLTRDEEPVKLWVVLYESALRYQIAKPGAMRGQYEHLAAMSERDNITIQVLPSDTRGFVAFNDVNIMILDLGLPTTVQVDMPWGTVAVTDKPKEVAHFNRMFDAMAADARPPGATPEFMAQLAREIAQ
ncbi:helix-turn-helix domain-containing protein [Streptomyces sp. NPDC060243]|uniref:helix-turn-helix domain-containing protein n=1 Tax=Streptomyces sp. NPDC060243 TaxID=3347081 RepID=UPI0036598FF3